MKRVVPFLAVWLCLLVSCSDNPSSLDLHHYREDPEPESSGSLNGIFRIDPSSISHFVSTMKIGLDVLELESGQDMDGMEISFQYGYSSGGIYFAGNSLDDWYHREGKFHLRRFNGEDFSNSSPTRCDFILNIKDLPMGTYTMYLEYRLQNTALPLTRVIEAEVDAENSTLGEVILSLPGN